MIERKRRGAFCEAEAELWKRWKAGQSLNEIGRALGKDHVVVHFVLSRHGGIAPHSLTFSASAYPGRARRHLPWNRERLRDASHRTRSASLSLHHQPGDHSPWWARAISSERSRSANLGVGPAAQTLPASHPQ
jgi:hypothetical protein